MLLDFCFKTEHYAKIGKVEEKTITKQTKDFNNFKFIFAFALLLQNVNF